MNQQKIIALIWVARISGLLSMVGSSAIIVDMCKNNKLKLNTRTSVHIIFLMTVADLISSFTFYVLGPIMAPKGLGYGTAGNDATCTAQGFIGNLFWGSSQFYSASLALYYVLNVRFGWKEDKFSSPCGRFWFLVFPIPFFLAYSIWPLTDGAHNFNGSMSCFLNAYPLGCGKDGIECTRGLNFGKIYLVSCVFIGICTFIIICSMVALSRFVIQTQKRSTRHSFEGSINSNQISQRTAQMGLMYSACFIVTYLPWFVGVCYILAGKSRPYGALVGSFTFLPLQGFFNALTYFYQVNQNLFHSKLSKFLDSFNKRLSTIRKSSVKTEIMGTSKMMTSGIKSPALDSSGKTEIKGSSEMTFGMSGVESSAFIVNEIMAIPDDTEDPSPPPRFAFLNKAMPDEDPPPPVMFDDENPPLPPQRDVELASPQQHDVSVFKLKDGNEEEQQQRNLAQPVSESVLEEKEETSQNNGLSVVVSLKEPSQLKEDESETSTVASASTFVSNNIKNIKVSVLRAELAKHNLPNVGRKLELFNRLQRCLDEEEFGQLFVAEVQVPTATATATAPTSTLTTATTTTIASPLIENGKPASTDAIDTAVLLIGKESNSSNSSTGSCNVNVADDNNNDNDGYNNDVDDSDIDVTTVDRIAEGGNTMN